MSKVLEHAMTFGIRPRSAALHLEHGRFLTPFPQTFTGRCATHARCLLRAMQISANGLRLEVEDHGPANGHPLLLIMGLGMQLTAWDIELARCLVARGFRVIRLDNRDIGLSQHLDELGLPHLGAAALKRDRRPLLQRIQAPTLFERFAQALVEQAERA